MAITHSLGFTWSEGGGTPLTASVSVTGEAEQNFEVTVPGSGNVVVNCELDVSQLSAVFIYLDGTAGHTITLTTNDDGTPDDTFTLTVGKPLVWYTGSGLSHPFASGVDVETFKATKATAVNATLKAKFLFGDITT